LQVRRQVNLNPLLLGPLLVALTVSVTDYSSPELQLKPLAWG